MNLRNGNIMEAAYNYFSYEANLSSPTQYKLQNIYQKKLSPMSINVLTISYGRKNEFPAMQVVTKAKERLCK